MNIDTLVAINDTNRLQEVEDRESGNLYRGDFEGTVTGTWLKLDDDGAGVVKYGDKEYITKRTGNPSIPRGTPVELTYARGIYYSNW